MEKNSLFFVPGGPWIDGRYWDHFLVRYFSDYKFIRHTLVNHEDLYDKGFPANLIHAVNKLNEDLNKIQTKKVIIAHSYGAWLTLLWLKTYGLGDVDKIIMINMPFDQNRTEHFNNSLKKLGQLPIETNNDFKAYFTKIYSLYFCNSYLASENSSLLECVFKEGNEKLLISPMELKELVSFAMNQKNIEYIFAEDDLIVGKPWENLKLSEIIIPSCGHFPMLEKPEKFSELLISLL